MKLIVLVVVAPLALTACKMSAFGANGATSNSSVAPEVVPDSVTVNGVVYTRAGTGGPVAAPTPAAAATVAPPSTAPSPTGRDDSAGVPSGRDSGQPPSTPPGSGHGG
ncbi:MAG: hypothetical protein V4459_14215 [Pseudomonadota bacterium]